MSLSLLGTSGPYGVRRISDPWCESNWETCPKPAHRAKNPDPLASGSVDIVAVTAMCISYLSGAHLVVSDARKSPVRTHESRPDIASKR